MDPGTAMLISGGVSALGNAIGGQQNSMLMAMRKQQLLDKISILRQAQLAQAEQLKQKGIQDISTDTAGRIAQSQADIARRAAASGRVGDVEANMLPAVAKISESGNRSLKDAIQAYDTSIMNIGNKWDETAFGVENDWAGRPLNSGMGDDLMEIGAQYFQYRQQEEALKQQKGYQDRLLDIFERGGVNATPFSLDTSFLKNTPSINTDPSLYGWGK